MHTTNQLFFPETDSLKSERPPLFSFFQRDHIRNTLFEGDCLDVLKSFPSSSVDMVLCDLPYGTTQNKWDCVIDLGKLWKAYHRVVKPTGAVRVDIAGGMCYFESNKTGHRLKTPSGTWEVL